MIEARILLLRGQRMMLSTHLAEPYGVALRVLALAVERNLPRFPGDFMHLRKLKSPRTTVSQLAGVLMRRDGVKGQVDRNVTCAH